MTNEMRHRIVWGALAFAIAVALACILIWLAEDVGGQQIELSPSKYDAQLLELDKEALEQAYRTQAAHLFSVWLRDETDQPRRITNGLRQARRAYTEAMTRIEAREQKQ